jgi:hypothetical protein
MFYPSGPQKGGRNANMKVVFSEVPVFFVRRRGKTQFFDGDFKKQRGMTTAMKYLF